MEDEEQGCLIIFIVICFIGFSMLLWAYSADSFMDEAVEAGHAHYYLDSNNQRQWEWLPPCGEVNND